MQFRRLDKLLSIESCLHQLIDFVDFLATKVVLQNKEMGIGALHPAVQEINYVISPFRRAWWDCGKGRSRTTADVGLLVNC